MRIESNIDEIIKVMSFVEKQIDFAASKALNDTATQAQKDVSKHIKATYKVDTRQKWHQVNAKFGVQRTAATKRDLNVEVYIPPQNTWIKDHELGESRVGLQLIPTDYFYEQYKERKNIAIKKRAKTLLRNKKSKGIFEKKINGNDYIVQKVKKDAQRRRRSAKSGKMLKLRKQVFGTDFIPLFLIKKRVQEKATLNFNDIVIDRFDNSYSSNFYKALKNAMKTAK